MLLIERLFPDVKGDRRWTAIDPKRRVQGVDLNSKLVAFWTYLEDNLNSKPNNHRHLTCQVSFPPNLGEIHGRAKRR